MATPRRREEARERGQVALSTELVAAVGLAWWTFMVKRRSLLRLPIKPGEQREKLGPVTLSVVSLALLALNGLLLAFLYSEVALPRWIGAGPIVLLALSCWTLVGSIVGFTLMAARGVTSQHALPLGTFLGLAGIAVVFVGDPFLAWYRGLLGA